MRRSLEAGFATFSAARWRIAANRRFSRMEMFSRPLSPSRPFRRDADREQQKGDPCTQDDFREVVSSEQGADVPARGFHDPRIAPHRHDHPAEGHQGGHDDHHEHHGSQDDADAATLLACGRQREAAAMDAFNSLLAPDSDEARCRNCAIWTVCPGNSGVGACWSAAHGDSVRATAGMMACDTDAFRLRG